MAVVCIDDPEDHSPMYYVQHALPFGTGLGVGFNRAAQTRVTIITRHLGLIATTFFDVFLVVVTEKPAERAKVLITMWFAVVFLATNEETGQCNDFEESLAVLGIEFKLKHLLSNGGLTTADTQARAHSYTLLLECIVVSCSP